MYDTHHAFKHVDKVTVKHFDIFVTFYTDKDTGSRCQQTLFDMGEEFKFIDITPALDMFSEDHVHLLHILLHGLVFKGGLEEASLLLVFIKIN